MMSDAIPSGKASYSGFTLVLDSQQVEEGKRWFDNLAANGKIEMAWQETFSTLPCLVALKAPGVAVTSRPVLCHLPLPESSAMP